LSPPIITASSAILSIYGNLLITYINCEKLPIQIKTLNNNTQNVLTIRQFQPTDTFKVIKLASITLTEQYNPSLFSYFYETYPDGFIVAELNHKIVGFLIGIKLKNNRTKILMISVEPLYQRQQIGEKLLNEFIKTTIERNMKTIELEVRTDNEQAIKFYEKNGFKIVEKIEEFYQSGESAFTMRRSI
jgi:ribosomal-protein-alanine N-acetyltransferase